MEIQKVNHFILKYMYRTEIDHTTPDFIGRCSNHYAMEDLQLFPYK